MNNIFQGYQNMCSMIHASDKLKMSVLSIPEEYPHTRKEKRLRIGLLKRKLLVVCLILIGILVACAVVYAITKNGYF